MQTKEITKTEQFIHILTVILQIPEVQIPMKSGMHRIQPPEQNAHRGPGFYLKPGIGLLTFLNVWFLFLW